ncbi:hypothetical protein [Aggregatibacter actinomycetemcomitans]|uniref:hypothetical protein n=1 Tax=Aggregatibacter actinomycetemcomitans TaxID=714 RepID=UPI00022AC810|nr:hypothetical protein [Aggregatibacter actinomycetemcomitans]AHN72153.1 hypothetical protein CF65_01908 [Aggregatibacter actinomycetemcomitans HK1651]QPQ81032.1 hypothetical protein I6H05_01355 [Aggregatibacter actinomycetemcomitans]
MESLKNIIDSLGAAKVANLCGISVRAVYKWRTSNSLPRTEYTGETKYSEILSQALENTVSPEEIRNFSNPIKSCYALNA